MEHLSALIKSFIDCAGSFGTRGLLCRVSCMDGSTAYMASNIARAVGIRRESQIRTRVATDFFLVQLQRGIDRTALAALGERLGGEGVLRLVIW